MFPDEIENAGRAAVAQNATGAGSEAGTPPAGISREVALPEPAPSGPWDRELIKAIAMDIGKEVVAYVQVQYPQAIEATSSTFKLSLRNCIYNQIMAAIEVNDAGQIAARLETRKKFRRQWLAAWRKIRETPPPTGGSHV